MSEYQYYEFLAMDRPLTGAEQAEVREFSSRAGITATRFSNEYHWGDFRGDPGELMRRYYDAHLYLTNWGTHRIMLRLPRLLLEEGVAGQYAVDDQVTVSVTEEHVIIDMISEDEDAFEDDDEDRPEPPVPAGLGSLTAAQSAPADFLRLDRGLLEVAATASPPALRSRTIRGRWSSARDRSTYRSIGFCSSGCF
jgi:hypothetical protein